MDVFIKNLIYPEIQKEPLRQTVEPQQARELAINLVIGKSNQHHIQKHNKTLIPDSVTQFSIHPFLDHRTGYFQIISTSKAAVPLYCSNCGGNWLPSHRDKCVTRTKPATTEKTTEPKEKVSKQCGCG